MKRTIAGTVGPSAHMPAPLGTASPGPGGRPARSIIARAGRRAAVGGAGPAVAGSVIALSCAAQVPLTGPSHWAVQGLLLTPAVLVHCHQRARDFTFWQALTYSALATAVTYVVMVAGLFVGAATIVAVVIAQQTQTLGVLVSVSSLIQFAIILHDRRSQTPLVPVCGGGDVRGRKGTSP